MDKVIVVVHSDEDIISELTQKIEERVKNKVVGLHHPQKGIDFIKNKKIDLLITDFSFGIDNASSLYLYLRKISPQTPVLLVSSMGISGIMNNEGMHSFLDDNKKNRYLAINEAKTEIAPLVADILDLTMTIDAAGNKGEEVVPKRLFQGKEAIATGFNFDLGKSVGSVLLLESDNRLIKNITFILDKTFKIKVISLSDGTEILAFLQDKNIRKNLKGILLGYKTDENITKTYMSDMRKIDSEIPLLFYAPSFPERDLNFVDFMESSCSNSFLTTPFSKKSFEKGIASIFSLEKDDSTMVEISTDWAMMISKILPDASIHEKNENGVGQGNNRYIARNLYEIFIEKIIAAGEVIEPIK